MHSKDIARLQRDDPYFATTLAKGMLLLRAFSAGGGWLGNKILVERTGLSKPTVTRLARTLVRLGYLRHAPERGGYALAAGLLELVNPYLAGSRVRQIARPAMQDLAEAIGGSVHLAVGSDLRMVSIESCADPRAATVQIDFGSARLLPDTSNGRAYLAAIGDVRRLEIYGRLRHQIGSGWATLRNELEANRAQFLREGFTAHRSIAADGSRWLGVGIPVQLPDQETPVAFSAVVALAKAETAERVHSLARQLQTMVQQVLRALGDSHR